jgi:outer membrane protein OmpA-like peptidoglycan-associated protein
VSGIIDAVQAISKIKKKESKLRAMSYLIFLKRFRLHFLGFALMLVVGQVFPTATYAGPKDSPYRKEFSQAAANLETTNLQDPFLDRLRLGYIQLSDAEWRQADKKSSKMYAQKAVAAMRGQMVPPSEVDGLKLPQERASPLIVAHQFLLESFKKNLQQGFPEAAAQAQLMFDCWMEQEQDGRKPEDIAYCKAGFAQVKSDIERFWFNPAEFHHQAAPAEPVALVSEDQLEPPAESTPPSVKWPFSAPPSMVPAVAATAPSVIPENKNIVPTIIPQDVPRRPTANPAEKYTKSGMPGPYIVFFDYNKKELRNETKQVLDDVVRDALSYKPDRIMMTGHADLTGGEGYNLDLAGDRVLGVATYLLDQGVSRELLSDLRAYGKNRTLVPGETGTKDEKNRYVRISFIKFKQVKAEPVMMQ